MGKEVDFNKPIIVKQEDIGSFLSSHDVIKNIDIYQTQIEELAKIKSPSGGNENSKIECAYVFFPWSSTLLKCVNSDDLFTLRTNRNRELITQDEQKILAGNIVGVAGMSVGSGIALGLAYSGISRKIKIADHDELDTSNLNRLRESLLEVGQPKSHLAARHIYELDPFANVHVFDKGVNEENIDDFFGNPSLDLVVDEIDDFQMKLKLRQSARQHKIPLLMFTSLGDNILVDVERYDIDEHQRFFNGLLSEKEEQELLEKTHVTEEDEKRYAVRLVGPDYIPTRALESVLNIGTELVGRPQLYSTIAIDGGLATYVIRRLLLHADIDAGRYYVQLSGLVGVKDDDLQKTKRREDILEKLSNSSA